MSEMEQLSVKTPTSGVLSVRRVGNGPGLVLLHRSVGSESAAPIVETLSQRFTVYVASMPGYDDSERPEWARSPRDLAAILLHSVSPLAGERPILAGFGLGGWVAAEMAAMSPERLRALVLVAPLGVQPKIGEIADPFLLNTDRYVELGFTSPEAYAKSIGGHYELGSDSWLRRERNREMTTRIAWRPRMFDQTLPFRLPYISTPTLLVWGEEDVILPRNGVERYRDAIAGSELVVVPKYGHMLECEDPQAVGEIIAGFVG